MTNPLTELAPRVSESMRNRKFQQVRFARLHFNLMTIGFPSLPPRIYVNMLRKEVLVSRYMGGAPGEGVWHGGVYPSRRPTEQMMFGIASAVGCRQLG